MSSLKCLFFLLGLELPDNVSLICCWAKRFYWNDKMYSPFFERKEKKWYLSAHESFIALPYNLLKGGWPPCYSNQDCGDSGGAWNWDMRCLKDLNNNPITLFNITDDFISLKRWLHLMFTAVLWDEHWALTGDWGWEWRGPRCVSESSAHRPGWRGRGTNWLVIMGTHWQTTSYRLRTLMGIQFCGVILTLRAKEY